MSRCLCILNCAFLRIPQLEAYGIFSMKRVFCNLRREAGKAGMLRKVFRGDFYVEITSFAPSVTLSVRPLPCLLFDVDLVKGVHFDLFSLAIA